MEVIVSAAVSSDGYLDDCTPRRLVLSCAEDWAEVHRLRAWCDAILVGAETVRRDNPSLVIRDAGLRIWREWLGMKPDLTKVTVTAGGSLDAGARCRKDSRYGTCRAKRAGGASALRRACRRAGGDNRRRHLGCTGGVRRAFADGGGRSPCHRHVSRCGSRGFSEARRVACGGGRYACPAFSGIRPSA